MTLTQHESWTGVRVAHPVADLDRSTAFYRDLLQLPVRDRFHAHDGYDGVIFTLPGGGELELTVGPAGGGPAERLLVLYTGASESCAASLAAAGVPSADSPNPYWNRFGRTYLDPDGHRIVIAQRDDAPSDVPTPEIGWHAGSRESLRSLFELAEDSASQLAHYIALGRILLARHDGLVLGHLQLVPTGKTDEMELKNMAVRPQYQGVGVGRALVTAAVDACQAEGWSRLVVATAAADLGNLRFYQRVGFRLTAIERDAFTPATGYPDPITIDRIPLKDRVWLARELTVTGWVPACADS